MSRIILDQGAEGRFTGLTKRSTVCNHEGRELGIFIPVADPILYERVQVPFTEEELDCFEAEPGGRSLAEILADLEKSSTGPSSEEGRRRKRAGHPGTSRRATTRWGVPLDFGAARTPDGHGPRK
jgi:hypothetical protein